MKTTRCGLSVRHAEAALLALLSNLAFAIERTIPLLGKGKKIENPICLFLYKFEQNLTALDYRYLVVTIAFFVLFYHLLPKLSRKEKTAGICFGAGSALIFSLCESYYRYDSWILIFGSKTLFLVSILQGMGCSVLFYLLWILLAAGLDHYQKTVNAHVNGKNGFTGRQMVAGAVVLLLAWLPYIIILFPGCSGFDMSDQVAQIVGNAEYCRTAGRTVNYEMGGSLWNNHHPVFHTWLLSLTVGLGKKIGSYPWAFEVHCIVQAVIMAFIMMYVLSYFKKMGVSAGLRRAAYMFYALCPIFPLWAMSHFKDTLFAAIMLLITVMLHSFLEKQNYASKRQLAAFAVVLLLLMLFRNNGFYLLIAIFPFLLIYVRKDKRKAIRLLLVFLIPILFYQIGYKRILFSAFGIGEGSIRETLSIPFQQTARYLNEYGEELTEQEKEGIARIFFSDNPEGCTDTDSIISEIADRYDPLRSDAVKSRFNKYASSNDLELYGKVWFSQLCKHPDTYIQAFLNMNYAWFYPQNKHDVLYYNGVRGGNTDKMLEGLYSPKQLASERKTLKRVLAVLQKFPVTGWIVHYSTYTWIYLIIMLLLMKKRRMREMLSLGVIYLNNMICFIGPVAYLRYALPMIFGAPVAVAFILQRQENSETT